MTLMPTSKLTIEVAVARPDIRTALLALDGLRARELETGAAFDRLTQLCGPHEQRAFAIVDLVLAFYTCDLTKTGVYRRNTRKL